MLQSSPAGEVRRSDVGPRSLLLSSAVGVVEAASRVEEGKKTCVKVLEVEVALIAVLD